MDYHGGMATADLFSNPISKRFIKLAYQGRQQAIRVPFLALHFALGKLRSKQPPSLAVVKNIETSYRKLLSLDIENAMSGVYPLSALHKPGIMDHLKVLPEALRQVPGTIKRVQNNDFKDLPEDDDLSGFPPYYRRNFHWQTDGYLSRKSAAVYDLQTDWLFVGAVNAMRRQVIPPIKKLCDAENIKAPKILDVGSGTGQTLEALKETFPDGNLVGCDLSPHYVEHAKENRSPGIFFQVANGEKLPFADGEFDVTTSTFLFHECPNKVRRNIISEMKRVTRKGGLTVLADSIQKNDSETVVPALTNFSEDYHEPYYKEYLTDPLEEILREMGYKDIGKERHFLAKVVVGTKPI